MCRATLSHASITAKRAEHQKNSHIEGYQSRSDPYKDPDAVV